MRWTEDSQLFANRTAKILTSVSIMYPSLSIFALLISLPGSSVTFKVVGLLEATILEYRVPAVSKLFPVLWARRSNQNTNI